MSVDIEVKILSSELIKPSTATPTQHQTHNLAFFDQLAPQTHVRLILFYSFNPTSKLENLQKSLSETLKLYTQFAGRFNENGLKISCQDQGVPYSNVHVNDQLSEFLPKAYQDQNLLMSLVPRDVGEVKLVQTPMLVVQVTSFQCGGLALAISSSHALGDGYSWATFLYHWSILNRLGKLHEEILPDFGLPNIFPVNLLPLKPPEPSILKIGAKAIINKTILFNEEAISSLKASCSGFDRYISRVVIVTATLWRAFICTSKVKHGYIRPSLLSLMFNLRGRNGLIPKNAFGNVFVRIPIRFSAEKNEVELVHLVSLLVEGIERNISAFSKASTSEEIASLALNCHNEVRKEMYNEEMDIFPVTSVCNFPFLDVDFGWGKPCWVCPLTRSEITILTDTKCGKGIEAQVNLNERDMSEFECDPNIRPFIF